MANKIYADMRKLAGNLLKKFDQAETPGNEASGLWYVEMVKGNGPAHRPGVSTPVKRKLNGVGRGVRYRYIDGTNILADDMQCTVAATDFVPNADGTAFIDRDGERYKILAVRQIPDVGIPIARVIIFGNRK